MNLMGTVVRVICPLFKKPFIYDFVYILSFAYIDQLAPSLGKIFMSKRIWMRTIMGPIGPEQLELFALELLNLLHSTLFTV